LGRNREQGEVYQAIVPAGAWFASETTGEYSFVGCTVSPGFDFADFELAKAAELISEYPESSQLIERLCRQ
jgi:predicted cupin superfamily sugar epimerase